MSEHADEYVQDQIDRLASFITDNFPGEPSQSEGAIDCAIRLMKVGLMLDTDELWESLPLLRLASVQAVDTAMQSFATDLMADSLGADLYRRLSG